MGGKTFAIVIEEAHSSQGGKTSAAMSQALGDTQNDDKPHGDQREGDHAGPDPESHDHAIRLKAEIMVDHLLEQVLAAGKIGGRARAMVVTSGIERAIQYFHAFRESLVERKSAHQAIVAVSGGHEYEGVKVSEASLNGFSSKDQSLKARDLFGIGAKLDDSGRLRVPSQLRVCGLVAPRT